ncbi:MAG: hypothetical protein OEZ54_09600 [Gemmatimonadota bacterium]|nr:hypothetical protein [Gemmatimonadota bacterium]
MAIPVSCNCGHGFQLKDEFAGARIECPECGAVIEVGSAPEGDPNVHPSFRRDKFLLRQKLLSIKSRYYVWDDKGEPVIYIERPVYILRNGAAALAGVVTWFLVFALGIFLADSIFGTGVSDDFIGVVLLLWMLPTFAAAIFVGVLIYKRRHLEVYADDSKQEPLMGIVQDKKFWIINATYTVIDVAGNILATLEKNYLYNVFRKRWICRKPDGTVWCIAKEESIILSLLRRFLGPLFGLLRVNFVILGPDQRTQLGEFNRKFTLLDRYVLDLSNDPQRSVDRRVAVALGVMLDTGERR